MLIARRWTMPNVGIDKATIAAQEINAKLAIPQFKSTDGKPTDFNDLHLREGLDEVRKQLSNAIALQTPENCKSEQKHSQASLVLELIKDIELFHNEQQRAYATFVNNGHRETWPIESKDFYNWIAHEFWKKHKKTLSKNILNDVSLTINGKACFDGMCFEVYNRVTMIENTIYIDLANSDWDIIKIDKHGWEISRNPAIKFYRINTMKELPAPVKNGNFSKFWKYVNIPDKYRKLVLAYILECFRTNTPYIILVLYGVQGCAKSTTQDLIRRLIDPSLINLRSAPKKSEDLLVAAANNYIVSFNNVSFLSDQNQDDLCCLSTGGGFGTRELFTTNKEAVIEIKRPVIMNGISDLVTAQDLIDRCVILELPIIDETDRKSEEELINEFNLDYTEIFTGLLDILVKVLQILPQVTLKKKPRMVDFAILGTALEKVMNWEDGSFMADYLGNRNESMAGALEHSPVAIALIQYIEKNKSYIGSYNNLYNLLTAGYKPEMSGWVKSAKGLANQIKRQKPALHSVGIEVTLDHMRHKDGYHVSIYKIENNVHQVHQVHKPLVDAICHNELTGEHIKPVLQSSSQVHRQNHYPQGNGEHNELSEHKNQSGNSNDKEVIIL